MITEDYVSYETAKLLKEKGFDESTIMRYDSNGEISSDGRYGHYNSLKKFDFISAPTLQMTMKWLREVHNIIIELHHQYKTEWYSIISSEHPLVWHITNIYNTYEQAAEVAIKYCLESLI